MSNLDKIRYANGGTMTSELRLNMQKVCGSLIVCIVMSPIARCREVAWTN